MFKKKLRGGVHPSSHKELSSGERIRRFPLSDRLYVSMQQHLGAPAMPVVKVGQKVRKGELLGASQGAISAPVHAPTSGKITAIAEHTAPHPSGLPVLAVTLEPDGRDQWEEELLLPDPFKLAPEEICVRVGAAGIVGLGGCHLPCGCEAGQQPENRG